MDWKTTAKPTDDKSWASNTNYVSGLDTGTPTKVEPVTGRKEDGWRRGDEPPSQNQNWWQNLIYKFLDWLDRSDKNQNLIINPSAKRGNVFWWDGGVVKNITTYADAGGGDVTVTTSAAHGLTDGDTVLHYNTINYAGIFVIFNAAGANYDFTPAGGWLGNDGASNYVNLDDPEYANPANFIPKIDGALGGVLTDNFWRFSGASGGFVADLGEKIPMVTGNKLVLSVSAVVGSPVAGTAYWDVVCYDSSGKYLDAICEIASSSDITAGSGYWRDSIAGEAPSTTDYVRVRRWLDEDWDASLIDSTRYKLESNTVAGGIPKPSPYTDEASMSEGIAARYTTNAGQAILHNTVTVVLFGNKVFDDPLDDRYNPATGIFTADRYMKLRVSVAITFVDNTPADFGVGDQVHLSMVIFPATYAWLDFKEFLTANIDGGVFMLNGTSTIELNKGDTFRITIVHFAGATVSFDSSDEHNYVDIHEI